MAPLTLRCPYCLAPIIADPGLFGHYVLRTHQTCFSAYYRRHPRTRKPLIVDDERLTECEGSELVLHQSDRRFVTAPDAHPHAKLTP